MMNRRPPSGGTTGNNKRKGDSTVDQKKRKPTNPITLKAKLSTGTTTNTDSSSTTRAPRDTSTAANRQQIETNKRKDEKNKEIPSDTTSGGLLKDHHSSTSQEYNHQLYNENKRSAQQIIKFLLIFLVMVQMYWLGHLYMKTSRLGAENMQLFMTIHDCNTNLEDMGHRLTATVNRARDEKEELRKEHGSLKETYEALLSTHRGLRKEMELMKGNHDKRVFNLSEELRKFRNNSTLLLETLEEREREGKEKDDTIFGLEKELNNSSMFVKEINESLKVCNNQKQLEKQSLEEKLQESIKIRNDKEKEIVSLETQLQTLKIEKETFDNKLQLKQIEINQHVNDTLLLRGQHKMAIDKQKELTKELEEKNGELNRALVVIRMRDDEIDGLSGQLQDCRIKVNELKESVTMKRGRRGRGGGWRRGRREGRGHWTSHRCKNKFICY